MVVAVARMAAVKVMEVEGMRAALPTVEAACPRCSYLVSARLEASPGKTTWCQCSNCQARFAAHRNQELAVICGTPVN